MTRSDPKYLTYDNGMYPVVVIFSHSIQHADMAQMLVTPVTEPLGAGFVSIGVGKDGKMFAQPYGQSTSLNMSVHEGDETLIRKHLNIG